MSNLFQKFTIWVLEKRVERDEREQQIRALSRMNRPI